MRKNEIRHENSEKYVCHGEGGGSLRKLKSDEFEDVLTPLNFPHLMTDDFGILFRKIIIKIASRKGKQCNECKN